MAQANGSTDDDPNIVATESSQIDGFSGDDKITGSGFYDQIWGGGAEWKNVGPAAGYIGDKFVFVGDKDTIDARGGNDIVQAGYGQDHIDGGDGTDEIRFSGTSLLFYEEVDAGGGMKEFLSTPDSVVAAIVNLKLGTYTAFFAEANPASGTLVRVEQVFGSTGDDEITGSDGDDWIRPQDGADTINGGRGFDRLSYHFDGGGSGITVTFGTGKVVDSFGRTDSFSNIEHVLGTDRDDTMTGTSGSQTFTGNNGADDFDGLGGIDTVDYGREFGSSGINVTLYDGGAVTDTYGKTDTLIGIEIVKGTWRRDIMSGDNAANELRGEGDIDNLGGGGGADKLYGGDANDTMGGGAGDDTLYGDAGVDRIYGGDNKDTIYAGLGDEVDLRGDAGDDTIYGGEGRDKFDGGANNDRLYGGAENDTITDKVVTSAIQSMFKDQGNFIYGDAGEDTLLGQGHLYGGADKDTVRGQGILEGNAGDDILVSFYMEGLPVRESYFNRLIGGDGKDTLQRSDPNDPNTYIADYAYAANGITVVDDKVNYIVTVSKTDVDTVDAFGNVSGTRFTDDFLVRGGQMFGQGGNDVMKTTFGTAVFEGGDGNDTITGSKYVDFLYGGANDDKIWTGRVQDDDPGLTSLPEEVKGGDGNDTINVNGNGKREVNGDAGNDKFIFSKGVDKQTFVDGGVGKDTFVIKKTVKEVDISFYEEGIDRVDLSAFKIANYKALMKLAKGDKNITTFDLAGGVTVAVSAGKSELSAKDFIL